MSISYEVEYTRHDGSIGAVSCTDTYQNEIEYYESIGYTINFVIRRVTCDHCDNGTRQNKNTRNIFKRVICEFCKGNYILTEEIVL
jgi:hypothetical protein